MTANSDEIPQITTNELWFRDPDVYPPPRAASLLLLNPGGVCVIGPWTSDCVGWCPKPKIPRSIKNKLTRIMNASRAD